MATEGPLTAAQIYEQITGGEGIGSLADAQDSAGHLTTRMVERAQRISALRAKTLSGWQGGAGEAAADATLPLVQAAADDAVHLKTAQTAVGAQMDAFGTAKNSVKPVAPQPPPITAADVLHVFTGQGPGYDTKVAGWQADSQANIEAFSAYHSASSTNGGQMPAQYAQLAGSGAPVSMTTPVDGTQSKTSGPTDTGEWARNPNQTRIPAQQDRQTVQPGQRQVQNQFTNQAQNQNQNQFQNQVQQPGTTNIDNTHANSYVPKPVLPPAAQGGYQFGPTGQSVSNLGGANTYAPFGPGTGGYTGGFGPGTGGYGSNTGSGYRPGTGTGRGTGAGPGAGTGGRGTGTGTGARMPEERLPGGTARGAAGARGANGMPMGGLAGGRGGKEEDKEKKSAPYLRNPDPDETFGGFTEKPMPPVIGENRSKK
ncbi:PPE domain-containing protein [Amycolatopsis sp. MEPSY49]|uniref:PPE domain-containing protein n=1 Tax=Amycolatopsis sp. MEPSY49 TaxID=3151600 RepID=UPI003EF3DE5D